MANDDSVEGEEDLIEEADEPEDNNPQTAEEIVPANLLSGSLTDVCDVSVTMRSFDTEEEQLVKTFADHGCTCEFGPHKSPCCKLFSADHYLSVCGALIEMSHDELDLFVMGQIMANCFVSSLVPSHHSSPTEKREIHNVMQFYHQGRRVCQQTFLFLHNIGIKRLKNIKASYAEWTGSESAW